MRSVVFLSEGRLLITAKSLSQFHLPLHMLEIKEDPVTAEMRFAGTLQIGCNYFFRKQCKNLHIHFAIFCIFCEILSQDILYHKSISI